MYKNLNSFIALESPATFIFCAGFEDRVLRAAEILEDHQVKAARVLTLTYNGDENLKHLAKLQSVASKLCPSGQSDEISASDTSKIRKYIAALNQDFDSVVLDISGMSRMVMMQILNAVYDSGLEVRLIYTEAEEYYPTKRQFDELTMGGENLPEVAFLNLSRFEREKIVYSMHCDVEEVEGLGGRLLPSYPLMLITFLTFKRGRVAAVLEAYEANVRILIKGIPVRPDLQWRASAIEIPSLDFLEKGGEYPELSTLDWRETYSYLTDLYNSQNNRYKYNIVLAPLGSKLQTVGAWLFAKKNGNIRVVSSTPKELFYEQYSVGFRESFVVDNLPFGRGSFDCNNIPTPC